MFDRSISHTDREPTAVSRKLKASVILEMSMSVSISIMVAKIRRIIVISKRFL